MNQIAKALSKGEESRQLQERITASFKQLTTAATSLQQASDDIGKAVLAIESALKRLDLGIPAWEKVTGHDDRNGNYWTRDIGYTRHREQWGICLRSTSGNEFGDPETYQEEVWHFNEAPHWMRVQAAGKIPDLLDSLVKRTDETIKQLQKKAPQVHEVAAVLRTARHEI